MLLLTRKRNEEIHIKTPARECEIRIILVDAYTNGITKIGIEAERDVIILRDNAINRARPQTKETDTGAYYGEEDDDNFGNR